MRRCHRCLLRQPKLLFPLLGLVAVFAALYLTLSAALAADSLGETMELQPGDNYVGWVAEPIGIDDLFQEIPLASLIYRWDADSRSWQYAIRNVGGNLETLQPGMAANIRIEGAGSVQWARPLTPAKGMVTLYRGVNWVTWVGRDEWPLDQVARGIGASLVSIRVGETTWPAPLDSSVGELPALRRGDALEVTVSRDLRWLQPTGMPPNIVPLGDISQSLLDEIYRDAQRVVDYFADAHGVETDFSDTTILVFMGVEAILEHQRAGDGPKTKESVERLRGYLGTWGVAGLGQPWGFVVSASLWSEDRRHGLGPVGVMAHEWFHYLQMHLPGRITTHVSPQWIVEGGATWSGTYGVRIADGEMTFEQSRAQQKEGAARTSVTLKLAETKAGPWHYQLGTLAHDLLAVRSGPNSPIEYLRQLHPQSVGPERRWQRSPNWEETFSNVYGLTPSQFYDEFETWRAELPHQGPRYDYEQGDPTLHGSLSSVDGMATSDFIITAVPYENEVEVGQWRSAIIDEEGRFTLDLKPDTIQRLWFTRDNCTLWLTSNGLTATKPAVGEYRDLDTANLPRLDLNLPAGACGEAIAEVEVLRLRGDDRHVDVYLSSDSGYTRGSPRRWGDTYQLSSSHPGPYRVRVRVGGCELWYAAGGLVAMEEDADEIELGDALVSLEVRIPHDLCVLRAEVDVLRLRGDERRVEVGFRSNSGFTWAKPDGSGDTYKLYGSDSGSAQVMVRVGGCDLWYAASGLVVTREDADSVELGDAVVSFEVRIPDDLCVRQISGRLINADGALIPRVWLTASGGGMSGGTYQDANGEFTITVPDSGSYQLSFGMDDCRIRYSSSGATTHWHQATRIPVADDDVTGIEFVVPAEPASLCN